MREVLLQNLIYQGIKLLNPPVAKFHSVRKFLYRGCSPPERGVQPTRNLKLTKHGRVGYQWKEHLKTFPKIYNMPIFESFTEGGAEKTLHHFRIFEKIRTKIFNLQFFLINYCKL